MELTQIPILAGAAAILTEDGKDPRHELTLFVGAAILLMLLLQALGLETGAVGQLIMSAFTLIIGYWFGQKETEKRLTT
jgi:hypothetical protein